MKWNHTSSGGVERDTVMSSALSGQGSPFVAPASPNAAVHTHQYETTSVTDGLRLNTTQNAPAQSATLRDHKNWKLRKENQSEAFTHLCRSLVGPYPNDDALASLYQTGADNISGLCSPEGLVAGKTGIQYYEREARRAAGTW